jgi:hypothetical protein
MIKIALCFYGQPRYVNNKQVTESYIKYFDRPEYEVATYGHCWFKTDAVYSSSSWTQNHKDYVAVSNTLTTLHSTYNFERFLVENPINFRFKSDEIRKKYQKIDHHINYSELRENNILSHLYSIEMVSRIVPDVFDFYVLCRYDTIMSNIPDLVTADKEKVYLPNCGDFSDIVVILGKKFLEWPKNLYTIAQSKHLPIGGFMPEEFKKHTFYEMGFNRAETIDCPMFGHIVRSE